MMRSNKENVIMRWLKLLFYANIIILAAVMFFLVLQHGVVGESLTPYDFSIERFGVIIILLTIPLSFKYYHSILKKILPGANFFNKFVKLYLGRFILIDFAIIFNLVCFHDIKAVNFIYLALIGWISLFFCFPALPSNNLDESISENLEEEQEKQEGDEENEDGDD